MTAAASAAAATRRRPRSALVAAASASALALTVAVAVLLSSSLVLSPVPVAAQCVNSGNNQWATRVLCGGTSGCGYRIGSSPQPTPAVTAANERCYVDSPYHYDENTPSTHCCPGTFVDSGGATRKYYSCLPTFDLPSPQNLLPTGTVSPIFPYGNGDTLFTRNDDGFVKTPLTDLGSLGKDYRIKFYGQTYDHIFMANNGLISFISGVSTYTGASMPLANCGGCNPNLGATPMIAVFWADVDTRDPNQGGQMQYRFVIDQPTLDLYSAELRGSYGGLALYNPNLVVVATWDGVSVYNVWGTHQSGLNMFQMVLFTDGFQTFVMFNYGYKAQQWDRGSLSGTVFAQIGFQDGLGNNFNADGTLSDRARDTWFLTNTGRPGRQIYRIDGFTITGPPAALSNDPNLANLVARVNGATRAFAETFNPTLKTYNLGIQATDSFTLTASEGVSGQFIRIGDSVGSAVSTATGVESNPPFSTTVSRSYFVVVYAPDSVTQTVYTVVVQVLPAIESKLQALAITGVAFLEGAFNPNGLVLRYSAQVPTTTTMIEFTAQTQNQFASVRMRQYGPMDQNFQQSNVPLNVGPNIFLFNSTAQNTRYWTLYNVTVTRAASHNAVLQSLTASAPQAGALTVQNNTNAFSVVCPSGETSISFVATAVTPGSMVSVNGGAFVTTQANGIASNIPFGSSSFTVTVRSESGVFSTSYTVTISRSTSTEARLASLSLVTDLGYAMTPLVPAFNRDTFSYAFSAASWTAGVVVTCAPVDMSFATMRINGVAIAPNQASATIALTPSLTGPVNTVLTIVVTAQNTAVTQTYTVTITRPAPTAWTAGTNGCGSVQTFTINRNEYISYRITTPANTEILHIDAKTNVVSGGAPYVWLRKGDLPNTGSTLGTGFVSRSQQQTGFDQFSSATVMNVGGATTDYYVTFTPGPASSGTASFTASVFVCGLVPTAVAQFATAPASIVQNRWLFFSSTTTASQRLPGMEFRAWPTTPGGLPDANAQYLRTWAVQSSVGGSPIDAGTFFGAVTTATNPTTPTGVFSSTAVAPPAGTRVLYGIFFPADVSAVTGFPTTVALNVQPWPTQPVISNVNPRNGPTAGTNVISITLAPNTNEPSAAWGAAIAPAVGTASVGGVDCTALAWDTQGKLSCTVPPGQGKDLELQVVLYGRTSPVFVQKYSYDPPTLSVPTWSSAPTLGGGLITITGSNFGTTATVTVDGVDCPVQTRIPHTQLVCAAPAGEGTDTIAVTAAGQPGTNTRSYVYDAPALIKFETTGTRTAGGDTLRVWGTNFGRDQTVASVAVTINSAACTAVVSNHTFLTCTTPAGAGQNQPIEVRVASVPSTNTLSFTYQGPSLAWIVPNPVPVLTTQLTIAGAQFGPPTSTLLVSLLGGTCSPVQSRNDTHIFCTPPPRSVGVPSAPYVTAGGQQSSPLASLLWANPVLTAFTPALLNTAGNEVVTLLGTDLLGAAGDVKVRFNGVDLNPLTGANATFLQFTAPTSNPAGLLVPVRVVIGGQLSNILLFNYSRPIIDAVAFVGGGGPSPDGTTGATIQGRNLGSTGTITLQPTGQTVSFSTWSSGAIQCTFPTGVGSVTITVNVAGQLSNAFTVAYAAPLITRVTTNPAAGVSTAGGDAVQIEGRNFGVAMGVGFVTIALRTGPAPCVVSGWSDTVISCAAPVGNGTNLRVTVWQSGLSGFADALTYSAPIVSTVTAASFPTQGGSTLIVLGTSVDTYGTVTVNGSLCMPITVWDNANGEIRCVLPPGGGAANPVVVRTRDGKSSAPFAVTYDSPVILAVNPSTLTTAGQTLTIAGRNLGAKTVLASVTVGGLGGNAVVSVNHTHLVFTLGATPQTATASIVVTYAGLPSAGYTVALSAPTIDAGGISPANGPTGPTYDLIITGAFFGDGTRPTTVKVGSADCPIKTVASSQIVCSLPSGVDSQLVQVTVGTQNSNTRPFQYDRPSVTLASPNTLLPTGGNTPITVVGKSFGASGAVVQLNGVPLAAAQVLSQNHTVIVFRMPSGVGGGIVVSVKQSSQTSTETSVTLSYVGPTITGVSPATGPTDGCSTPCVVLTGQGFGPGGAQAGAVSIGGQSCAVALGSYSDGSVSCTLASGSGAGLFVTITVNGAPSNSWPFAYTAPAITGITVQGTASPAGGSTITIAGSNFGTFAVGSVSVNGTGVCSSSPALWASGSIQCSLPAGAGNVALRVTVNGQSSNAFIYRYAAPTLGTPVPASGPTAGGTSIVIPGNNLGSSGQLTIGGLPCVPSGTGWTNTRIECTTPPGPGGADSIVSVTVGGQSATTTFSWDVPVVYAVEPQPSPTAAGVGAQPVVPLTVSGMNFGAAASLVEVSVNFGDFVAAAWHNHTHARLDNTPVGTGTGLTVRVRVNNGLLAQTIFQSFAYRAPTITSVTTAPGNCEASGNTVINCLTAGGYTVTINGRDLGSAGNPNQATVSILIGTTPTACTAIAYSSAAPTEGSQLTCTFPAGTSSNLPLTVTVNGQTSAPVLVAYTTPTLDASSLRLASGGAGAPTLLLATINGGDVIRMNGRFLGPNAGGTPAARFGTPGTSATAKEYACQGTPAVTGAGGTTFECAVPLLAVGSGLAWQYFDGLQWSPESSDRMSFPAPAFMPGTIRRPGESAGSSFSGLSSQGEDVEFQVSNVGNDLTKLRVFYDQPGGTFNLPSQECLSLAVQTPFAGGLTYLRCRTQSGNGGGYRFKIQALNQWSAESSDTYAYPTAPVITAVTGCTDVSGSTMNCATTGGVRITLTGTSFQAEPNLNNVLVGVSPCPVVSASANELVCTLPAGTGQNVYVSVFSGQYASLPVNKLSYALAQVTSVAGCTAAGATTVNCPRLGGNTIVITGTGFGPSGAFVFVGASRCLVVSHVTDTQINCTLPRGTALDTNVLVIQASGTLSANTGLLSYVPCALGRYQSSSTDYACTPCAAGSYADQVGLNACKACPVGTATAAPAQSVCTPCAAGTIADSTGRQTCDQCPAGKFTSAPGQGQCTSCPAQSFAAVNGSTLCAPCPAGTSSTATGTITCTPCTAGSYQPTAGGGVCQPCPAGTFNDAPNSVSCTPCAAGSAQPSAGQTQCVPCTAGYAVGLPGQVACVACESGTFANVSNLAQCLTCPAGEWSKKVATAGPTACTKCLPGTYLDAAGQSDCISCPKGRYSSGIGARVCDLCVEGTFASVVGSAVCTNCTLGTVATARGLDVCTSCPAGTFTTGPGSSACTRCPAGTYSGVVGLTATQCTPCGVGGSGLGVISPSDGQTTCVECAAGLYQDETAQTVCKKCPVGRFNPSSHGTRCYDCLQGQFAPNEASAECSSCPAGTFNNQTRQPACTDCARGSFAPIGGGASLCTPCAEGSFAGEPGSVVCTSCPVGAYSNVTGSTACPKCAPGTQQANTGSSTCTACVAGWYALSDGQRECFRCGVGSVAPQPGASQCTQCGPGTFAPAAGLTQCLPCLPGTATNSPSQSFCPPCAIGTVATSGNAIQCSTCVKGSASNSNTTGCQQCPAGKYAQFDGAITCTDCPIGQYQPQIGQTFCSLCDAGFIQPLTGQASCAPCPTGTEQPNTAQIACVPCAAGKFASRVNSTACSLCPAGTANALTGQSVCPQCSSGRFSQTTGLATCSPCPVGQYSDNSTFTSCQPCKAGTARGAEGYSFCDPCAIGRFAIAGGSGTCQTCPPGSYADRPGMEQCTPCPAGSACDGVSPTPVLCGLSQTPTFSPAPAQAVCSECQAGKFANATGLQVCFDCPVGKFTSNPATRCSDCAAGFYAPSTGLPECARCPAGTFSSLPGQSVCTPCSAGSLQPESAQTGCVPASPGFVVPAQGQAVQTLCPFGQYSEGPSNTQCTNCPAGRVQNTGSPSTPPTLASCVACGAGFYSPTAGQQNCLRCDAGTFSNSSGLTACFVTPAGSFSPAGAEGPTKCLPGTHASANGAAQCQPCPARTFSDSLGTVDCSPCPITTFGNETGLAVCHACPKGTFGPVANLLSCLPCQPGQYGDEEGQAECKACIPGTISTQLAQASCAVCALGKFAPNFGSVQCTDCPVGTIGQVSPPSVCAACEPGKYQDDTGKVECIDCPAGSANNFYGQVQCSACSIGTIAPLPGMLLCVPCTAGQYQASEGRTNCTACPRGKTMSQAGATACSDCPAGRFQPDFGSLTDCLECPANTSQPATGASSCVACEPGKSAIGSGTVRCTECPAGTYGDGQACRQCVGGYAQPEPGKQSCIACAAGFASSTGATTCTICESGKIAATNASATCEECRAGLYSNGQGATACRVCEPGSYSQAKALTVCSKCVAGTALPNTTQNSNETFFSDAPCPACPPGTFSSGEGATECELCPVGRFNNDPIPTAGQIGAEACAPCPVGRFANETGFGFGTNNPVNSTDRAGQCLECPPGRFNDDTGRADCQPCPTGTYNTQWGQKGCTACNAGSHNPYTGLTRCFFCIPGTYTNENTGRVQCVDCPLGTHASGNGTANCQACAPGYFANTTGSVECTDCPPGTKRGSPTQCDECAPGTFQAGFHALNCPACAPGTAHNRTGQAGCPDCDAGYYASASSATSCIACPSGRFVNQPGKDRCTLCPVGTAAAGNASTECTPCAPGTYQNTEGALECIPCALGKYATGSASVCSNCGNRQVAPRLGSFECYACDVHATTDDDHTVCRCESGYAAQYTFNNRTQQREANCVECPRGAVCNVEGVDFDTMQRANGYWCSEPGTYYLCLIATDCPQGACSTLACAEGTSTCDACANGRTGPLCAYCLDGWSQNSRGECVPCSSDKTNSFIYTVAIVAGFCILLIVACYVMVRASDGMMDIAAREDEKMRLKNEGYIQNFNEGFLDDQWRFGRYISLKGAPPPKPDFTFKLKILLGFVQIITNLAVGLQIEWPTIFKAFLQAMNPANLDFVKFSSIDCIRRPSYYDQLILFALVPPALLVLLIVLYFLPHTCRNLSSTNEGRAWRKRVRRNFWKLWLFLLFLVYPTVSATVLRLYVCIDVNGTSYLRADLTTQCYTDTWNRAAYANLILVVLYPVLIPVFFLAMLMRYRKRLDQSGVRAELGFLYDGFERSFYLFELVDMIHKLGITSLVAFLPDDYQLKVAMAWVTLYLIVILWRKPYIRKGDDILHLFVQIEIMLLLMAGIVFATLSAPDDLMDGVLSVVLIAAVLGLFLYFLLSALNVFVKWLRHTECAQNWSCLRGKEEDQQHSIGGKAIVNPDGSVTTVAGKPKPKPKKANAKKKNDIASDMKRQYRVDRHTLRQHGRVATARGQQEEAEVEMVRNAAWGDAELAKVSFAELRSAQSGSVAPQTDLVRSPRASGGANVVAAVPGAAAQSSVFSPRRALLAYKLGEELPAGTAVPVPAEQLTPLTPNADRSAGGVELQPLGSPTAAGLAVITPTANAAPDLVYSTGPHPATAAAEQPRGSVADLAQPLGTTPAGAAAAIELQPVSTAPIAPIEVRPASASAVAEPVAVPDFQPAAVMALPVVADPAPAAADPAPRASMVADVPVAAVPQFAPIALEPIAVDASAAPASDSAVAAVPSAAAVPTFAPITSYEPLPSPKTE